MAQSKSTLEHALGAMHDGFLLLDAQDRVVAWNQRYVDLFPWLADTISVVNPASSGAVRWPWQRSRGRDSSRPRSR